MYACTFPIGSANAGFNEISVFMSFTLISVMQLDNRLHNKIRFNKFFILIVVFFICLTLGANLLIYFDIYNYFKKYFEKFTKKTFSLARVIAV